MKFKVGAVNTIFNQKSCSHTPLSVGDSVSHLNGVDRTRKREHLHRASTRGNRSFIGTFPAATWPDLACWNYIAIIADSSSFKDSSCHKCHKCHKSSHPQSGAVLAACAVSTPDIPSAFPTLVASMAALSAALSPAACRFQMVQSYHPIFSD